jgi:soluble lytic murein transglycosylase
VNRPGLTILAVLLLGLGAQSPALAAASHAHKAPARKAQASLSLPQQFFAKLNAGDAAAAHELAQKIGDKLIVKYERWAELSRGLAPASFAEISGFIEQNPDWPGQAGLKRQAEEALMLEGGDGTIITWFQDHEPQTREGRLRLGDALRAVGRGEEGNALIRRSWVEDSFSPTDEKLFLDKYAEIIQAPDHILRIDRLLWREQDEAARRQMRHVSADMQALAEARLKLQADNGGIDAALARVPARLKDDPGLLYDRLRWARENGNDAQARDILLNPPSELIRPDLWWAEREIQARHAINEDNGDLAYRLVRNHGLSGGGSEFAEAEFLSGWIAFRMLSKPEVGLQHFDAVYRAARYPAGQARGAYWAGRAADAVGETVAATDWYIKSASSITTFYGQLAASRLGAAEMVRLPAEPQPSQADKAAFAKRDVVRLVQKLAQLGGVERIDPFILRLAEQAGTPGNAALVAELARSTGRTDLAVQVARKVQRDGIVLVDSGYPVLTMPKSPGEPEAALIHALIRQESNFNAAAVSKAGAQGLMQLMPATAKSIATKLGLPFAASRLAKDPTYNMEIGQAFIGNVLNSFSGSYVLSIAAYNAGPGRVRQWLRDIGDPRDGKLETIDWIERVPFSETRNYIQRVLEGLQVYRLRLNHGTGSPRFGSFASAPEAGSPWCLIACTATAVPVNGRLE